MSDELRKDETQKFLAEVKSQLPHVNDETTGMSIVETCFKVNSLTQYVHEIFEVIPESNTYRATLIVLSDFRSGFKFASGVGSLPASSKLSSNKKMHILRTARFSMISFTQDDKIVDSIDTLTAEEETMMNNLSKQMWAKLKLARGSQSFEFAFNKQLKNLGQTFTVLDAIKGVADAWKAVAEAFKTINRETLSSITQGQGFSQYAAKSRFIRSIGINISYWNEYITNMMVVTDLDKNDNARAEVNAFLDLAYFIPDNACYFNQASFDMDHDGRTNSVVMLSNLDMAQNKANILTVVTQGTFTLDPDVYIYQQFKSVAGGIYQNTKEVRKNVKRQLTK